MSLASLFRFFLQSVIVSTLLFPISIWAQPTSAVDSFGRDHNGILAGAPTWSEEGVKGNSLCMSGVNDAIMFPADLLNGAEDVTISAWIKTSKAGQQTLISAGNIHNANELILFLHNPTTLAIYNHGGAISFTVPAMNTDTWRHVVVVRDQGAQEVSVYIDGVLVASQGASLNTLLVHENGLNFGQEQDCLGGCYDLNQRFVGCVDEIAIYHSIYTADQIANLYASYQNNDSSAYLKLDFQGSILDALVVEGDTHLKGNVYLEQPQGDISMGIFGQP